MSRVFLIRKDFDNSKLFSCYIYNYYLYLNNMPTEILSGLWIGSIDDLKHPSFFEDMEINIIVNLTDCDFKVQKKYHILIYRYQVIIFIQ